MSRRRQAPSRNAPVRSQPQRPNGQFAPSSSGSVDLGGDPALMVLDSQNIASGDVGDSNGAIQDLLRSGGQIA